MKKLILLLSASLVIVIFMGANKIKALKNYTKLSDKTYLYNYEVSVDEYYQFLKENKYESQLLPDKSVFDDSTTFGDQIISNGFSEDYYSSKYGNYPIVGINSEQGKAFCRWKMAKLNTTSNFKGRVKDVRLPTLNEYFTALLNIPIEVRFDSHDQCKFIQTNNKENEYNDLCEYELSKTISNGKFFENLAGISQDGFVHLAPVDASYQKVFKNLLGNVSEFVSLNEASTTTIPVGNNFSGMITYSGKLSNPTYKTWDETLLASKDLWNKPSSKIGFRYVIVLK